LIGDFIINLAVQPSGDYIVAHTITWSSYLIILDNAGNLFTSI